MAVSSIGAASSVCMSFSREDEIRMDSSQTYACTLSGKSFSNDIGSEIVIQSDGDLIAQRRTAFGTVPVAPDADEWHRDNTSAGLGDDWDVRATLTAGTTPDEGTIGSWEALSTSRTWGNDRTSAEGEGTTTSTLTFEFRAGGVIWKTVTGIIIECDMIVI